MPIKKIGHFQPFINYYSFFGNLTFITNFDHTFKQILITCFFKNIFSATILTKYLFKSNTL
jgi:hypothetical protein